MSYTRYVFVSNDGNHQEHNFIHEKIEQNKDKRRRLSRARRRRKFFLKGRYHVEISWHYGNKTYVAECFDTLTEKHCLRYGETPKLVTDALRLAIAEMVNPEIVTVRLRFWGVI